MSDSSRSCCVGSLEASLRRSSIPQDGPGPDLQDRSGQVWIPGGRFMMGDHFGEGYPGDGEGPVHEVELSP